MLKMSTHLGAFDTLDSADTIQIPPGLWCVTEASINKLIFAPVQYDVTPSKEAKCGVFESLMCVSQECAAKWSLF